MLSISKGEVWSLLNILKEIRDGSETEDLREDAIDLIEMLEAIQANDRMNNIARNGNEGLHYD